MRNRVVLVAAVMAFCFGTSVAFAQGGGGKSAKSMKSGKGTGSQGPSGPMGLRGPQGAQGLPGLAGTAPLRVLDANGVEVGRVIGVGSGVHYSARMVYPRVLLQSGNDLFAVHVTRGHLIGDVDNATLPRFTSSDCSGPAFVSGSPEHRLPSVSVLSVSGGFDVYLPDLDAGATSVTFHSYFNVGGECIVNTLTRAYFPSRPVIHLSFVAPFSVEFVP